MSLRLSKDATSEYKTNVSTSPEYSYRHVDVDVIPQSTSGDPIYNGEDDSIRVFSGNLGDYVENDPNPIRWGFTAPSGSRIELNDSNASGRIDIVHNSGAGIALEGDGSLFMVSKSERGLSIAAPFGDISISAGGEISILGDASISVRTSGDLTLDVGGSISMRSESFKLITNSLETIIDGSSQTSITQDNNVIIGGIDRRTIAGDQKLQISKKQYVDVGEDSTNKIGGNFSHDVSKSASYKVKENEDSQIKGNFSNSVKGSSDYFSEGNLKVNTKGEAHYKADGNANFQSDSNINVKSGSNTNIQASSNINEKAGSNHRTQAGGDISEKAGSKIAMEASSVHGKPGIDHALFSDTSGHARWADWADRSQVSNLAGSAPNGGGGSAGSKPSAWSFNNPQGAPGAGDAGNASPSSKTEVNDAKDAEVPESEDIIDNLTSARKFPKYPGNGVLESANATGYGMISDDEMDQAEDVFNEYSSGNVGNPNPAQEQDILDTIQPDRIRNPEIVDTGQAIPAQTDLSAKISKYFTLSQLIKAKHSHKIPPSIYQTVVKEHIKLANNVLDKVKERFPDILITSCYRPNSKNHKTGRAVDLVVNSRSMSKHAEIARFAAENLPCDQVFLEKNTSGKTHVHLRLGGGKPRVLTCGDAKCKTKVNGIQLAWLGRRAK